MTRRMLRATVSALGVTTICCLWIVGPLVLPSHDAIYHWSGPASTIFIPATLDFISVWILLTFLLFAAQGGKRGALNLCAAICMLLPWIALKSVSLLMNWVLPHWVSRSLFGVCSLSITLFCISPLREQRDLVERLRKRAIDVLCVVAISGAIILVQLAWFGWQARGLNRPMRLHQPTSAISSNRGNRPRFIWILLDELSYQQVYERRFHTLNLPAFDRLAKQSSVFTDVAPAGDMTEIVMPSLMTGLPIDKIQPSSNGFGLEIHDSARREWVYFDQHGTIFSDALFAGYNTAIAGWYNPYCRILPEVLDHCFWAWGQPGTNMMLPRASISDNVFNPLILNSSFMDNLASSLTHVSIAKGLLSKTHILDFQQISASADELLQDPAIDFILIHMAVPHPGGIYSRTKHAITAGKSTYIDNLALADSYLGHVRALLEAQGQWDSSAIVVMGDHSWRTKGWSASPDWTLEEQEASSGGKFDDRPGLIVKLPQQKIGNTITTKFPALYTRKLLGAIIAKRIVSPTDLSEWLKTLDQRGSNQ